MRGSKAKYVRENAGAGTSYTPLAVSRGFCTPDNSAISTVCAPCRQPIIVRHKTLPDSLTSGS